MWATLRQPFYHVTVSSCHRGVLGKPLLRYLFVWACPACCHTQVIQMEMERLSLQKAAPKDKAAATRLTTLDAELDSLKRRQKKLTEAWQGEKGEMMRTQVRVRRHRLHCRDPLRTSAAEQACVHPVCVRITYHCARRFTGTVMCVCVCVSLAGLWLEPDSLRCSGLPRTCSLRHPLPRPTRVTAQHCALHSATDRRQCHTV